MRKVKAEIAQFLRHLLAGISIESYQFPRGLAAITASGSVSWPAHRLRAVSPQFPQTTFNRAHPFSILLLWLINYPTASETRAEKISAETKTVIDCGDNTDSENQPTRFDGFIARFLI